MISPSQRPLPDNTQHSQQTNFHAPSGIRTQDLNRREALDLPLDRAVTGTGSVIITSRNFEDICSVSNSVLSHMIKWITANNLVLNIDRKNITEM